MRTSRGGDSERAYAVCRARFVPAGQQKPFHFSFLHGIASQHELYARACYVSVCGTGTLDRNLHVYEDLTASQRAGRKQKRKGYARCKLQPEISDLHMQNLEFYATE